LYYFPVSPYSQCVKIALNYKGLDEIECLPISLKDKPTWYVEKVYPVGKVSSLTRKLFITSKLAEKKNVPALEHNGKVKGESLDLLVYIDQEFGGPNMTPTEEDKKEAAAKLLKYRSTFVEAWLKAFGLHDATPALLEEIL
ncbi:unnamed protein product, partial [Sphagnum tenellum]